MKIKKILIVIEDEEMVQKSLMDNLTTNGFEVFAYSSAEAAIASDIINIGDAIIMDIQLPGMNGWEATALVKKTKSDIPIVMLTAYSDVNYRVQGFETGADDYIIKPFFMEELVARLKAVLKRYEMIAGSKRFHHIGDLEIDTRGKTVFRNGLPVKLSLTEFNLLSLLAEHNGLPVSKDEILRKIWKGNTVGENTIEVYINLLRNKVDKPFSRRLIHTKAGFGYYLSDESS